MDGPGGAGYRAAALPDPGEHRIAVTRSGLAADLRRLGVPAGGITMAHTRMSALGWVVGAAETGVRALLDGGR